MRVLVTGASGFVGWSLVPDLLAVGHDVRAATRRPATYHGSGVPVLLDVRDGTSLAGGLVGCDVAYYLVHSMEAAGFTAADRDAAARFADAATAVTGRRRVIVKVPVRRPLVHGLSVEVIATDDRIRSLVPFSLLGYDDAVRLAVSVGPEELETDGDE